MFPWYVSVCFCMWLDYVTQARLGLLGLLYHVPFIFFEDLHLMSPLVVFELRVRYLKFSEYLYVPKIKAEELESLVAVSYDLVSISILVRYASGSTEDLDRISFNLDSWFRMWRASSETTSLAL